MTDGLRGGLGGGPVVRPGLLRSEQIILLLFTVVRVGALVQMALIIGVEVGRGRAASTVIGLSAGLAVESLLLIGLCWRVRVVVGRWVLADAALCAILLILGATATQGGGLWVRVMTPLVLVTFAGLGLAALRTRIAAIAAVLLAGTFVATVNLAYHTASDHAVYFLVFTVAARVAARELRIAGRALESARIETAARAEQLAREQERARHARLMHDRVLQTLETLARPGITIDDGLRAHIAAEATWLRTHLTQSTRETSSDLITALSELVERKTRTGLRVDFTAARAARPAAPILHALPPAAVEAVVGAVGEALTNVTKHADTQTAVLHVTTETRTTETHRAGKDTAGKDTAGNGTVVVSILDQGRGFDLAQVSSGLGLDNSIRSRIAEVGGTATIDSTPGAGTHVELRVPITPQPAGSPSTTSSTRARVLFGDPNKRMVARGE